MGLLLLFLGCVFRSDSKGWADQSLGSPPWQFAEHGWLETIGVWLLLVVCPGLKTGVRGGGGKRGATKAREVWSLCSLLYHSNVLEKYLKKNKLSTAQF